MPVEHYCQIDNFAADSRASLFSLFQHFRLTFYVLTFLSIFINWPYRIHGYTQSPCTRHPVSADATATRKFIAFYGFRRVCMDTFVCTRASFPKRWDYVCISAATAATPFNITNVLWVYRRRCRRFISLYDLPFGVRKSIKRWICSKTQEEEEKYVRKWRCPTIVAAGRFHG